MEITEHLGERWVTTIFVQNKDCNDCRKTSRCLEASRMIICTDFEERRKDNDHHSKNSRRMGRDHGKAENGVCETKENKGTQEDVK